MFNLKYIGHAGWLIENNDFKCLCDPWFSPNGAFFTQWYPFPRNDHLFSEELINDLDCVYISHMHEDHFDPWVLEKINKNTTILIPKFLDNAFSKKIREIGFKNVVELSSAETMNIKDIEIKIIEDDGYFDADSALILDDGKHKILNLNDCHIDFKKIKEIAGDVDLLLLQTSSAIWWPVCYNYNSDKMVEHGRTKRKNVLSRALKYARVLNAKAVIPNAGPPFFLDPNLDYLNYNREQDYNPFPSMTKSVEFLNNNGVSSHTVIPGSTIRFNDNGLSVCNDNKQVDEIYNNLYSYIEKYRLDIMSKRSFNLMVFQDEISNMIKKFEERIKKIKKYSNIYVKKIKFPILFEFESVGKWIVDFQKRNCFVPYENQNYKYHFILNSTYVCLLFRREIIDFESYFLGCNFSCDRNPDEYNEFLFAILKNFDIKSLLTSERIYSQRKNIFNKTFDYKHKGKNYKIQKYCPHQLADLEEVGFVDEKDNFVCPLHGWKFNLKDGKCLNKANYCLKIESKK